MRWIKFSDKMPPVGRYSLKSGAIRSHLFVTEKIINNGYWPTTNWEWLDETAPDPAEVLVKALEYFASEKHLFDAATRNIATEALEKHEQLKQQ